MADVSLTARADEVWVAENPQDGVGGELFVFTLTVPYATTLSSGLNDVYRNRAMLSTSLLASTTATTSGNVLTSAAFTPSTGIAGRYVLNFRYKQGNQIEVKKLLMRIGKQSEAP
jgi:hypothetical protein